MHTRGPDANGDARLLHRPAQVVMVPAVLLLLVPGSVGLRGLSSMLGRDTLGWRRDAVRDVRAAACS